MASMIFYFTVAIIGTLTIFLYRVQTRKRIPLFRLYLVLSILWGMTLVSFEGINKTTLASLGGIIGAWASFWCLASFVSIFLAPPRLSLFPALYILLLTAYMFCAPAIDKLVLPFHLAAPTVLGSIVASGAAVTLYFAHSKMRRVKPKPIKNESLEKIT